MDSPTTNEATASLRAHSEAMAAIVDAIGGSTVAVLGRRGTVASGVVWKSGLVVTAAHVFRRTPAAATLVAAGGRSLAATLVGIDSATDLALFRLAEQEALAPLAAGDAATVRAGHTVVVVGRSGEGDAIASAGIVNRVGGAWQTWLGGSIDRLIRLDGGVYDGLSGAPVADASGALIGVATAALSRSYGIVVPAPTVSRVVDALVGQGRVARPWLGIGAQSVPVQGRRTRRHRAERPPRHGARRWRPGRARGSEDRRHHRPCRRERCGQPARAASGLAAHVGGIVTLGILRGGAPLDLSAEVGEWPEHRCR
jgi:S1-C subfamily serine protease